MLFAARTRAYARSTGGQVKRFSGAGLLPHAMEVAARSLTQHLPECRTEGTHLFIPEVTGNRRNDSLLNLLENPGLGLLVLVPGFRETLRINGRAWVTRDPELLESSAHGAKVPLLGIGIRVDECYLHCAKAAIRGALWNPLSWPAREQLPDAAEILRDHTAGAEGDGSIANMQNMLRESYTQRLY